MSQYFLLFPMYFHYIQDFAIDFVLNEKKKKY